MKIRVGGGGGGGQELCSQKLRKNYQVKGGFHETTNILEMNHQYIKISRQVGQTCRHRLMDIGGVLAAD